MAPLRVTRAGVVGSIVVFLVAAACVRLGIWQLHRLADRRAHNAGVGARMRAPPYALDRAAEDTAGLGFRAALAAGRWDGDRSIVLAGRSLNGEPGVYLLTPLLLPGGGAVLVNRGWLPSPDAATVDLRPFADSGAARVRGILVPADGVAPAADTFKRVWYHFDLRAAGRQFPYPLEPLLLQLTPEPGSPRLPRPLPPPALDEGPHLSYAVQWFSFAVIGLVGWVALLLHRGGPEAEAGARPPQGG